MFSRGADADAGATQKALFTGLGRHVRVTLDEVPDVPLATAGLAEVRVLGNR